MICRSVTQQSREKIVNIIQVKFRIFITTLTFFVTIGFTANAIGGVALGATRVIYPEGQKQVQLSVTNSDEDTYLIQSWIENIDGVKDSKFIVTPPLFAMQGKKENTLRIIDATSNTLAKDRESLFWINVKAIPSMDKSKQNENTLQLAIISRIKLYYRPSGLLLSAEQAAEKIKYKRENGLLTLINPTPYYITIAELNIGSKMLDSTLVPPFGNSSIQLPASVSGAITYRTINDYGALTPKIEAASEK